MSTFELFLTLIIGMALGGFVASGLQNSYCQKQAIEAGVAKFVVDEKTGVTQFKYIK
jgi:hypothetical protein